MLGRERKDAFDSRLPINGEHRETERFIALLLVILDLALTYLNGLVFRLLPLTMIMTVMKTAVNRKNEGSSGTVFEPPIVT